MKIPKRADITSIFKCPRYPELKPINYKLCLGRQLTKLAGGGWQYPECVECVTGIAITKHFEGYQLPVKRGAKPNWNTYVIMNDKNKKRASLKAQVELVIDYIRYKDYDKALRRLGMILEEM